VLIAHRLSTVRDATMICVMSKGAIIERTRAAAAAVAAATSPPPRRRHVAARPVPEAMRPRRDHVTLRLRSL
jgi:ABC-type microcin C transport system duplicated ATPase subunit YejF